MSVNLSPLAGAGWQFFDDNGDPLAGGLLYTYTAGTTSPQTTYTDDTGGTPNANPIVLDSAGRVSGAVWLTSGVSYKFVLQDADAVQIGVWDDVFGINDIGTVAFQTQLDALLPAEFASPPPIGDVAPNTGAFTTLDATTLTATTATITNLTVNTSATGNGFDSLFASPPVNIGSTAAAGGTFKFLNTAPVVVTYSAAVTIDCALSNVFTMTFGAGDVSTVAFSNLKDGQTIRWFITQDGTGGRTIDWTGFTPQLIWLNGVASTLKTGANDVDMLEMTYRSSTNAWYASLQSSIGAIAESLTTNGYTQFPNGLYLLWGSSTVSNNSSATVTFPGSVTMTTFSRVVVSGGEGGAGASENNPYVTACSTTGFTVFNARNAVITFFWIGVGY